MRSLSSKRGQLAHHLFPTELEECWVPVMFANYAGETIGDGWVMQSKDGIDFRLLPRSVEDGGDFASVIPLNMPQLRFEK